MNNLEDLLHLVARFAEDERARDIRSVAFHRASAVDQHDGSFANFLRCDRTMRERGILADLHIRAAFETQLAMRADQNSARRFASCPLAAMIGRVVGGERYVRRQTHQLDFMRALDHAAAGGDRSRARERRAGRRYS